MNDRDAQQLLDERDVIDTVVRFKEKFVTGNLQLESAP